ncbi:MAG TPA: acyl-CoA desaturase [Steroidobacteraceae bacterium]|nr:acyl-CoA desaturase [Steroidobacteraceae bacterium]HRX88233.1 acyl-CoA desaturase [Steroidobacteraceae bacterium]
MSLESPPVVALWQRIGSTLRCWFDTSTHATNTTPASGHQPAAFTAADERVEWARIVPFVLLHAACLAVFWVGVSAVAVGVAVLLYFARMFAITGFYHRYFSHRSYKTTRTAQFIFGVLGASAVQRGPIWWAAHHRHHHAHSDREDDPHSPIKHGFLRAHMSWFLSRKGFTPDLRRVRDLLKFRELRWLDRFDILVPVALAIGVFSLGVLLERTAPELGTNGWQMLVWGFFVSTVACSHGTYTINSLSHVFGKQRYRTGDASRNNFWLALLTLGEGWHNNHHHYPSATRQGFYWWEIDITWYLLKVMSWLGIIWDLKTVPVAVRDSSPRRIRPLR